jgi:hypothetical protein
VSMETTLARAEAQAAERDWRNHRLWCSRCSAEARSRHWDQLCNAGAFKFADHQAAQRALAKNRRLDKLPSPDQAPLF